METTATIDRAAARQAGSAYSWLPFGHLNLRRNPFGELTQAERMELAVIDTAAWRYWLSRPKRAIQFIAPCGFGKSTHLLALMRDLPLATATSIYLPERPWYQPFGCAAWPKTRELVLDEAQRLPRHRRRRLFSRYQTLLIGTHRDVARDLDAVGIDVKTVQIRQADAQHIATIINRRIEAARLGRGPIPRCERADAQQLVRRFGGNVRAIESYLFDCFQLRAGATDGEVRFID